MRNNNKLFVATSSFGSYSKEALSILKKNNINFKLNPLKRKLSKNELIKHAKGYHNIIAGTEIYDEEIFSALEGLKYIFRLGSGIENIEINSSKKYKVKVEKSKNTPEKSVAELVMGFILNYKKNISIHDHNLKNGIWKKKMGNLLYGSKVGIIGFGKIGKYLYKILKPFGVEIFIYDIKKSKLPKRKSLKYLLKNSDIISIHINSTKKKLLLDKKKLNLLKNNCLLINTSRAEVIDNLHLFKILQSKKILGACLDVYENEPYSGKFTKLRNILLTPHIGSYSLEIRNEMEIEASKNFLKYLRR